MVKYALKIFEKNLQLMLDISSTAVRRTTALHYSDRVIYYIKFDNCHGYLMTGVCQEFCIQRIQTVRWRDIADAQSFLVMQLRRETGIWG